MARFANTIDNQPIYAARAEADKNGDRIDTTYAKLTDIPDVPVQDVEVDGTSVVNAQGVAEITMPTVPTATSDLTNDSGFITASDVPAAQTQADWSESDSSDPSYIQNKPDLSIYAQSANLATVATSGNYNDLSNLPTIPPAVTVDQHYNALSSNPQSGTAVAEALSGTGQVPTVTSSDDSKVLTATYSDGQGSYSWQPASAATQVNADWEATSGVAEILHKPDLSVYAETADLATVATTGDYDDLVDAPTIVGLAAGANVTITEANNTVTIAATDTTYTAGTGISISGGAISNSDPIPSHTSTQSGKVLGVDSNGDLDWVTPAASQVQANWNESDSSAPSFIQNKPTIPTVDQFFNPASTNAQSGTAVAGALSTISQVPPTSQASAGDVLTVDQYGDATWVAPSAQAQVQSDWTESDPTEDSYIQHKPNQKPLVAGQNVVLTEGANNITIDCTASGGGGSYTAGNGIDITNNVVSVDTSVVATQSDLADKEDAFDVGTGLEMDTSGATPTLQVEAPVDIVAGPGIVIDNPDGNTLRVSTESDVETVLWQGTAPTARGDSITLSESVKNFDRIALYWNNGNGSQCMTVDYLNTASASDSYYVDLCHAAGYANSWIQWLVLQINTTARTILFDKARNFNFGSQSSTTWTNPTITTTLGDAFHLYKVIGIHRIANN